MVIFVPDTNLDLEALILLKTKKEEINGWKE